MIQPSLEGNPFTAEIARLLAPLISEWPPAATEAALESPADPSFGDYALPCFPLARTRRSAPPKIAAELAQALQPAVKSSEHLESVHSDGGYLNFHVKGDCFARFVLGRVLAGGDRYGGSEIGAGRTICIDFSSPNIAKLFHVGHLRGTLLGAALSRVFRYLGYSTTGINHLGDWGTQFGKLLVAYRRWGDPQQLSEHAVSHLQDLYVRFHKEADAQLETEARSAFKSLETGDPEARRLWELFRSASMAEFQRIYDRLGVTFESQAGESFYEDKMQAVLDRLAAAGLSSTSEEALVVDLGEDLPPFLLRKQDEATLYATRDLAAALYRHETYRFHKLLYVVGQAQELHFRQLFAVLRRMGLPWADDCEHVPFGWVKFKDQHLKTREGNIVLLDEVLGKAVELAAAIIAEKSPDLPDRAATANAVGIGAVIFADLATRRIKDVNFDWEEVLSFDYGSGPYVQYSHARLCSILRKYEKPLPSAPACDRLVDPGERLVLQKLDRFPRQLELVAQHREPSYLCSYLVEVASAINSYLQKGARDAGLRILTGDPELAGARVALVSATRQVIHNGLQLLGMQTPERM
jgi:arginyl-tRNA synthetase